MGGVYFLRGREEKRPKEGLNISNPEVVWVRLKSEALLANADSPYLALIPYTDQLQLKLKGAVVWEINYAGVNRDSAEWEELLERLTDRGKHWVKRARAVYSFTSTGKIPDSVLTVIARALNTNPEVLQREIPRRFRVWWEGRLITDFVTDVKGSGPSTLKNAWVALHTFAQRFRGGTFMEFKIQPDEAITLYRIIRPNTPLLIAPEEQK